MASDSSVSSVSSPNSPNTQHDRLRRILARIYSRRQLRDRGNGDKVCEFGVASRYVLKYDGRSAYVDSEGYGVSVVAGHMGRIRRPPGLQERIRGMIRRGLANGSDIDRLRYAIQWMFEDRVRSALGLIFPGENPPKPPDELRGENEAREARTAADEVGAERAGPSNLTEHYSLMSLQQTEL